MTTVPLFFYLFFFVGIGRLDSLPFHHSLQLPLSLLFIPNVFRLLYVLCIRLCLGRSLLIVFCSWDSIYPFRGSFTLAPFKHALSRLSFFFSLLLHQIFLFRRISQFSIHSYIFQYFGFLQPHKFDAELLSQIWWSLIRLFALSPMSVSFTLLSIPYCLAIYV